MTEWQPIASAPKDGTKLLLFIPTYGQPIHIGWFHDSTTMQYGKVVRESHYWMTTAGFPSLGFSIKGNEHPEPFHWMALPSAPAEARS